MSKRIILKIVILLAIISSYNIHAYDDIYQSGEELTYSVSFLGINLGTIEVFSLGKEDYNGQTIYRSKATMQSNPSIPFAYLSATFNSWMSPNMTHSHKFEGNNKFGSSAPWVFQRLLMEYEKENVIFERWVDKELNKRENIPTNKKINDGSSLFFFARQFADSKRRVKIPTIIDDKIEYTYIDFSDKMEDVEIDAVDYPVRTIYFDGKADWEGIYGLSGEFEGWFSDDEASIPIRAKMKVYVGSVDIELIKWKREGWTPPKAK
jgi:hypothetical protein